MAITPRIRKKKHTARSAAPKVRAKAKPKAKPKANRQIKSSMFSMLFSDIKSIIELVNALLGTHYGADTVAEIATLKNVLSCGRLNDLAIVLDNMLLVLIEHQSTVNKNMAYRLLEYVTEIYRRRLGDKDLYGARPIQLLRPVFIVLYNGIGKMPARELQRLSDLYAGSLPAFTGMGGLELEVVVINVNDRRNKKLVKTCKLFNEYCIFVDTLRRKRSTMSFDDAVKKTVEECIARNVLRDFLRTHRKELFTMLVTEWNWDTALKVAKEENFEMGLEMGMEKGVKKGIGLGLKKGRVEGIGIGVKKGIGLGLKRGMGLGLKNTARAMKREGMSTATISRLTGLSVYSVRKL